MHELFRALPSVDACLAVIEPETRSCLPHALLKTLINQFLDARRDDIRAGRVTDAEALRLGAFAPLLCDFVRRKSRPGFRKVLNATGVVVHTNMGRSILADEALEAIQCACSGYSNLELNLETGRRGLRYSHVEGLLCRLTGAEAALVVNNNAAAVFLTLLALCRGREVIVARGQLVEIGGSFRIPDVMSRSGAILREVGCTNRVHYRDYEQAISPDTAAVMRVHTSNFRVVGFHADVPVADLASLAHAHDLPLIEDLGSGSLVDLSAGGLSGEPTVREVIGAGADVVTFSGDKVLGGPQAGIIVGRKAMLDVIKADPLNRALRIDKMTLAALEATLRLYLDESAARRKVPTLRMLLEPPEILRQKARRLAGRLKKRLAGQAAVTVTPGASRVGGGAFPENDLPGYLVRIRPEGVSLEQLRMRLLQTEPPLVGRIEDGEFCLDPRTLPESDWPLVADVMAEALSVAEGVQK